LINRFKDGFESIPGHAKRSAENVMNFFKDCRNSVNSEPISESIFQMAISTIPYLTSYENEVIWQKIESSGCYSKLSEEQREWVTLFKAIGKRDGREMAKISCKLLENPANIERDRQLEFLLISNMLGNILIENLEESINSWMKYSKRSNENKRGNLLLRLLIAHSIKTGSDDLNLEYWR